MRAVWFMHLMSTCDNPAVRSDLAQASSHFTREACVEWILYYVPKCGAFWGNYCCLKVKCFFLPICGEIQKQKSWIFAGNISICVLEQLSGIDLPSFMASLPPTWLECSGEGAGTRLKFCLPRWEVRRSESGPPLWLFMPPPYQSSTSPLPHTFLNPFIQAVGQK